MHKLVNPFSMPAHLIVRLAYPKFRVVEQVLIKNIGKLVSIRVIVKEFIPDQLVIVV